MKFSNTVEPDEAVDDDNTGDASSSGIGVATQHYESKQGCGTVHSEERQRNEFVE